jgi:hypothetical protein
MFNQKLFAYSISLMRTGGDDPDKRHLIAKVFYVHRQPKELSDEEAKEYFNKEIKKSFREVEFPDVTKVQADYSYLCTFRY